jgi:hypothetical protein
MEQARYSLLYMYHGIVQVSGIYDGIKYQEALLDAQNFM